MPVCVGCASPCGGARWGRLAQRGGGAPGVTLRLTLGSQNPPSPLKQAEGGEKLRSAIFRNFPQFRNFSQFSAIFRNFPQFSAIFPQFFSVPDFLTASPRPRCCRTMRFFFYYAMHSLMFQVYQMLAYLSW